MAIPLKASFFHSLPNQSRPVPISMLKRLLLSHYYLHQNHHYILQSSPVSKNFQFNFKRSSWPFSIISSRPFRAHRVLAMAEREDKMASHSHNLTNRLAAEHSPYLLQHAHNPMRPKDEFLNPASLCVEIRENLEFWVV
ncbi:spermatogenesis-associated protein 20-like isoform X1 [Tripterygium wilfordii]|uniref:Spermatogenesis-associated protein 20-like isoform X1 n=1 Tax=Tripterygium wilfordii TaxID=458696 RepID=A0A7J7DD16_TRIWF|nr:uncharacterized protein LOC120004540 [Tripterygium wilfordii]KAF5744159.1 spermatogenesis-associated protein 20-like isoform X1 [Tripterygium wilfordii]